MSVTHLGEGSHERFVVLHPPSCVHQDHIIVLLVALGGEGRGRDEGEERTEGEVVRLGHGREGGGGEREGE